MILFLFYCVNEMLNFLSYYVNKFQFDTRLSVLVDVDNYFSDEDWEVEI